MSLCIGICADKIGNFFNIPRPALPFTPHPIHGFARPLQADMVAAEAKEDVAGKAKHH